MKHLIDQPNAESSPFKKGAKEIGAHGATVFSNIYSDHDVSLLRQICKDRIDKLRENTDGVKPFVRDDNAWITNQVFRTRLLSDKFLDAASEILSTDKIRLYHTASLFKEPGDSIVGWHQDGYLSPLNRDVLTAWIPLVDMPDDNIGAMYYAIDSHLLGVLPPPAEIGLFTKESDQYYEDLILFNKLEKKTFPVKAGDVIFHKGATLHTSVPNSSDRVREALTVFLYPDGAQIAVPSNSFQISERRLYFPGLLSGDQATSPINPLFRRSIEEPRPSGSASGKWVLEMCGLL